MYLFFFLVWILFNGKLTLEIALSGLAVAALVYGFACRFLDWGPKKDLLLFFRAGGLAAYTGLLLREILKANVSTIAIILKPDREPEPVIVRFRTKLRTRTAKVMLANSITLTPGTITVSLEGEELTVHCLDRAFSEGLADSAFERALSRLERPGIGKRERGET